MRSRRIALIVLALAATVGLVWGVTPPEAAPTTGPGCPASAENAQAPAVEAPATFTVQAAPLKLHVELEGIFVAEQMTPVVIAPEVWSELVVLRTVAPGTEVRQGDPIVWLDMSDIDRQIAELEAGEALADLALAKAQEELRFAKDTYAERLAWAQRAARIADEDYADFQKRVLPFQDQYAALDVRGTELSIEMAREEVRQLTKMYEADEFVEETESMVLTRNRFYLERSELDYTVQAIDFDQRQRQEYQRRREQQEWGHASAVHGWEQVQVFLPMELREKELGVAKMQYDRQRAAQKLADLKADREKMIVLAPADGVVYFGECVRGGWPTAGAMDGLLRERGHLPPNQVIMTIVQPGAMFVRAEAAEAQLRDLHAGNAAQITPTGYPDRKLQGRITDVIVLPPGPGQFSVRVGFDGDGGSLMPGMACKVKLLAYENSSALTVPAASVFAEPSDEDARYVWLAGGAQPVKTSVQVGRAKGDQLEITQGLSAGDVILLTEPASDD